MKRLEQPKSKNPLRSRVKRCMSFYCEGYECGKLAPDRAASYIPFGEATRLRLLDNHNRPCPKSQYAEI